MEQNVLQTQPIVQQNDPVIVSISHNNVPLVRMAGFVWIADKVDGKFELDRAKPEVIAVAIHLSQQSETVVSSGQCDQKRVATGHGGMLDLHTVWQLHLVQSTTSDREHQQQIWTRHHQKAAV